MVEKDKRIAELQRLVDGDGIDAFSSNDSVGVGSVHSSRSANTGGDAIWSRLQVLLNQTRAELAEKEEHLKASNANLALQKDRVATLEKELEDRGSNTIKKLKDECKKLEDEKRQLEYDLEKERKDAEEKIRKKDEALVYFRNELFKLKQSSSQGMSQRSISNGQHISATAPLESPSTHSQSSVSQAFGGITALVAPSLWSKPDENAASTIATPRLDF